MSPIEARDSLRDLFEESQTLVQGTWENHDEVSPFECEEVGGGQGVQFLLSRIGTSPGSMDDAESAATQISNLWESRGYPTTTTYRAELGYRVNAEDDTRSVITFAASENAMTLGGGSSCVPGDRSEVRKLVE
jgi:hypothetical protein